MDWNDMFYRLTISDNNTLGIYEILAATLIPFFLTLPVSFIYRYVQKNNSYSTTFIQALLLFAPLSSVVTIIIGNNVARAFGLVGALSIVRFRNALKDPLDAIFIFWSLVIGMACGTGYYMLAALIVTICTILLLGIQKSKIAHPRYYDSILKITFDAQNPPSDQQLSQVFKSETASHEKINEYFDSTAHMKTAVYTLKRKSSQAPKSLETKLQDIPGLTHIHHLNKESSLFLESRH